MSGSVGSSSGSSNTAGTAALDPDIKARWLQLEGRADDAYRDISNGVKSGAYNIDPSQYVAPLSDLQQQALGVADYTSRNSVGEDAVNRAVDLASGTPTAASMAADPRLTQGAAAYRPAYEIQESLAGPAATYGGAQTDASALPLLKSQTAASGISPYLNASTDDVINRSMADLYRGKQMADQDTAARATQAGAFGGSRHGVADAETNRAFLDALGRTTAQERQGAFQTAVGASAADQDRGLTAGGQNLSTLSQIAQGNTGYRQQAGLAGADAQNDLAKFNAGQSQNADIFNANNENTAALDYARAQDAASGANADRTLQALNSGGNLQLGAAGQLGTLGQTQRSFLTSDYDLLKDAGSLAQGNDQALRDATVTEINRRMQLPMQALNAYLPAFGNAIPTVSSGGSTTSNTNSRGKQAGVGIGG